MSTLKNIRQKLGLSQRAMAHIMGVNRSSLSMVELGDRPTPSLWRKKLNDLEQQMKEVPIHDTEIEAKKEFRANKLQTKFHLSYEKLRRRYQKMMTDLDEMRKDHDQAMNLLNTVNTEMRDFEGVTKYIKFLKQRKENARDKMLSSIPFLQKTLEMEIECVRQSLLIMEKFILSQSHPLEFLPLPFKN